MKTDYSNHLKRHTFPSSIEKSYLDYQKQIDDSFYRLYELAKLAIPKVYFFKSPLALAEAFNYINTSANPKSDFTELYPSFFKDLTKNQLQNKLNITVQNAVISLLSLEITSSLADTVNHEPTQNLKSIFETIDSSINQEVSVKLGISSLVFRPFLNSPSFRDRILVNNEFSENEILKSIFQDFIQYSLMYCYMLNDVVLWCPMPFQNNFSDEYGLHNEDGPSLAWGDGFALYHYKGVLVKKRLIEQPETYSASDIKHETNPKVLEAIEVKLGKEKFNRLLKGND